MGFSCAHPKDRFDRRRLVALATVLQQHGATCGSNLCVQHCWCDTTAITEPHCGAFLGFGKQQGGNRHSMAAEKKNGLGKVQDPEIAEHDKAAALLRIQQVEPGFHSKSNVPESSSSHFHIWSWAILWNPLTRFELKHRTRGLAFMS